MTSILFVLLLSAAAYAEPGVHEDEIVLGVCTALTGTNKGVSQDQLAGAKAYIAYINHEKNGIHGRKIRLAIEDDAFNPDKAIDCFNQLLKEDMFAMAFVNGSPTGAKYVHMSELHQVPIVGFNSGARFISDPPRPYVFNVRSSFDDEAAALVDHLWKEAGIRRFGVLYEEDAFGAAGLLAAKAALMKHNAELVSIASVVRDDPHFEDPIKRSQAADPQAVILAIIPPVEAELLKASRAAGWKPLFATISGKDDMVRKAGPAANGVVLMEPVPFPSDTSRPGVVLFNQLLHRYVPDAKPTFVGLVSFTEARVVAEALNRAGKNLTREKFIKALEGIDALDVGLGADFKVRYSKDRHVAFDTVYPTVARNGKLIPLDDWTKLTP